MTKPNCSGRPWLNTRLQNLHEVPYRDGHSETYSLQSWHDEVGSDVDPVCGLHPVGPPDPGDPRVAVQVHVQLELADEVEVLQVVLARLVVGARVRLLLRVSYYSIIKRK